MTKSKKPDNGLNRRNLLKSAVAAGVLVTTACGGGGSGSGSVPGEPAGSVPDTEQPAADNPIVVENARPGTQDWRLTNTSTDPQTMGRSPAIEGYCSANSIRAGETLQVMVSTNPVSFFKLEIFRSGYYNGDGGRLMRTFSAVEGVTQDTPVVGNNYVRECQWVPSIEFEIPADWLSGVYLGKLTAETSGLQSYVIFIVRDDRDSDLLFQSSELTWSAYNRWPTDFAVYTTHEERWTEVGIPSATVSFDRPYALFTHPVNRMTDTVGAGEFLSWEFPLSFWLEQRGYDVSYISNIDTHTDREGLLRTKGFISVGHDEYWTTDMYDNVLFARDAGINLAFLGANTALCNVPLLESSDGRANRAMRREGWFLPFEPGQEISASLLNQAGFEPNMGPDGALLMGARHPIGEGEAGLGQGVGNWTCAAPEHWLYTDTLMLAGDSIEGLVGWEFHGEPLLDLPGIQIVAEGDALRSDGQPIGTYTATIYDGPQGNIVFNAATIWWANGLSSPPGHVHPSFWGATLEGPDERVQQITHNLFQRVITGSS